MSKTVWEGKSERVEKGKEGEAVRRGRVREWMKVRGLVQNERAQEERNEKLGELRVRRWMKGKCKKVGRD